MKWENLIQINTHYTRSINLERDVDCNDVIKAYIPTTRSLQVFSRIANSLGSEPMPRSWALTGPYGSGKSSFGIFLSNLLGPSNSNASKSARKILKTNSPELGAIFDKKTKKKSGHCCILLTGSPEPLGKRFLNSLHKGASQYWQGKRGRVPALIEKIKRAASSKGYNTTEIIQLLAELQNGVAKSGGSGVLIVIDELGKFLEYEARHYGVNDIYLLQAIAEQAGKQSNAPLQIVVLLHQAFEQYTRGLGERLRNDWKKVQGRFENIPFLETTEQVLRVLRATFSHQFNQNLDEKLSKETVSIAKKLDKANALPGAMEVKTAAELFKGSFPIHPVSLLMLPPLCQRVAQNERTLFSYLGSQEPHGFRDSLSKLDNSGKNLPWILPWELYEYFILNQTFAISDHFTHRRWAEVITALERLGDAHEDEIKLLKTIGLLNIIGAQGGLKASEELLSLCFLNDSGTKKNRLESILLQLKEKSLITYRKFSGEYRVWQGSDFDLESNLQNEINQLHDLDIANILNTRCPLSPLVARRYTISTGSLRYFKPIFVDNQSIKKLRFSDNSPKILIFLADSPENEEELVLQGKGLTGGLNLGIVCLNGEEIRNATTEVIGLERVQRNSPELSSDPVAERELKDRFQNAISIERELLKGILNQPGRGRWIYGKEKVNIKDQRTLQEKLSEIFGQIFNKMPFIHNELINRDRPSSSAMAARNKLLPAILNHGDEVDLGFDKYPPEKAIYKSVFLATGIHQRNRAGSWKFGEPSKKDPCRVIPVWKGIKSFFERSEKEPLKISSLFLELSEPPYGLKSGIVPLLFIAAYLEQQHETALYEDGIFCPALNLEILERLVRNPEAFSIQRFKLVGMRASIYEKYIEVITGEKKEKPNLLEIARPLAKFMNRIPDYTKKTKTISSEAQNLINSFFKAKSPADLLFNDIPLACGYSPFNRKSKDNNIAETFSHSFVNVLRELKNAYSEQLFSIQKKIKTVFPDCKGTELSQLREQLRGRYIGLDKYTIDIEGLKAFINRLCDSFGNDTQWLESVAAFLGRKPAEKWSDEDIKHFDIRLADFSKRLRDLEKLRLSYEENKTPNDSSFEAILLKIIRQDTGEREYVVNINDERRKYLKESASAIWSELGNLPDENYQLALLAEMADQVITKLNSKENAITTKLKNKGLVQ